jgi:hypothetical protein
LLVTSETGQAVESEVARQAVTFFFPFQKKNVTFFFLRGATVLIGLDIRLRDRRGNL